MRRAIAGLVLVLVLGACTPGVAPAPPVPTASTVALDNLPADEQTAVAAVDEFWRRHYPELFGRPYQSPRGPAPASRRRRTTPSTASPATSSPGTRT